MSDRRVMASLLNVNELPTLPQVVARILETVQDDSTSAADLTAILEKDHAISARVLRLANSAFYGLSQGVESIRRAVIVLGFDAVRHLALGTTVFDVLSKGQEAALEPRDFWMHSFGTARIANVLSRQYCRLPNAEACYTAGLLHDVGKYLLALALAERYEEIVAEARQTQRSLRDVEQDRLDTDHAEIGGWIAGKWNFPPLFRRVIGNQYRAVAYRGPFYRETAVVALSSELSRSAGFGLAGDFSEPRPPRALLELLELDNEQLHDVQQQAEGLREETRQFLHLLQQQQT